MSRGALTPSSRLPLVCFGLAHAGLAAAFAILAIDPELPGGYFLHPRMAAVVHLLTIAWISGSIIGAFYIVAPLALGLPLPVRWRDWLAGLVFAIGTAGMVAGFWTGRYGLVAWAGTMVLAAILWVALRTVAGVRRATAPWPILLHVLLAFANVAAAALYGVLVGVDREYGWWGLPLVASAFAHLHLAVLGWPVMLVIGLAYRLVPMFLPARPPAGHGLALSAILLELGLILVVFGLAAGSIPLAPGVVCLAGALWAFVHHMRRAVKQRLPRPPALPQRDWSTWQTHVAIAWLFVAAGCGVALASVPPGSWQVTVGWIYGVAGLVGFIGQIIVGIQGRLVPLYAYYRAMSALGGQPPRRGANELPTARFARPIFLLWTVGVPLLAWGLASGTPVLVRISSLVMLAGVGLNASYLAYLMRVARD